MAPSTDEFGLCVDAYELHADQRRIQLSLTLEGLMGALNVEVQLLSPDGVKQAGTMIFGLMDPHFTITLHMRQPAQSGIYRCRIELADEKDDVLGQVEQPLTLLSQERSV